MFGFKICIFLALSLAYSVQSQGDDFEWLPCLQKALAEGIPSLDIPSKDPWEFSHFWRYYVSTDLFHIDISYDFHFKCNNVPWWTVTNFTVTDSSDEYVDAEYTLQWKNVSVEGNFAIIDALKMISSSETDGNFSFVFEEINWNGRVTLNKATETSPQYLNDLTAHWEPAKDLIAYLLIPNSIEATINVTQLFNNYLWRYSDTNQLGEAVRTYINDNWLKNTTNYEALMESCKNN